MDGFIENSKVHIAIPYKALMWRRVMHFSNLTCNEVFDRGSYRARKKEQ